MITFGLLGHESRGRLGNQLFQIASTYGVSFKAGQACSFPNWKYAQYFKSFPRTLISTKSATTALVKERFFEFDESVPFRCLPERDVDLDGWLQSSKYWQGNEKEIHELFRFSDSFMDSVMLNNISALNKPTIAISVRIGEDYIKNGNYAILPVNYYLCALFKHFPDWRNYNLLIFSDDIEYCKVHFSCLPNVYFANGTDIEQLCLMSCCDHFIIANSTFSWWGAYLGKENKKVIYPAHYFAGGLAKSATTRDFWPEEWTCFDHLKNGDVSKIDLSDTTFTVPVSYDHPDRKENLELCLSMLRKHFDCKIIVGEQGSDEFANSDCDLYVKFSGKEFHRTKMLNEMAKLCGTKIVVNWDADVICPPLQIFEMVESLRGNYDMVYPYDGRFARVSRNWIPKISQFLDCGFLKNHIFKGMGKGDFTSVGGAVGFKKDSFFSGGGENEKFVSYSPEDMERKLRFERLGYKIDRIKGVVYHIDHYIGINSSATNPHYANSQKEFDYIRHLNGKELLEYVSSPNYKGLRTALTNNQHS